jgi:hypothetical protein
MTHRPPLTEHPLQRQIADALRLKIAPPGKVSGHGVVWWSVDHASYAGTAPGARVGRGIVAGVPDTFVLWLAGSCVSGRDQDTHWRIIGPPQVVMATVLAGGGRVGVVRNAEEMLFLYSAMERRRPCASRQTSSTWSGSTAPTTWSPPRRS